MKFKNLFIVCIVSGFFGCLVSAIVLAFSGEAFRFQKTSNDVQYFIGAFPPEVKTIAMISPASYPDNEFHRRGIDLVKAAGYKVKLGKHAFDLPEEGKLNAPLAVRLEDFYNAWNDDEVDMIVCVRGGAGCFELLNSLDFSKLKKRDNLRLQGFSDVTILLCAMHGKKMGSPIAGPMGAMAWLEPVSIKCK